MGSVSNIAGLSEDIVASPTATFSSIIEILFILPLPSVELVSIAWSKTSV